MDNESNELLKQLEEENQGKLTYKTYALFLGESGNEGAKNLGGLLYVVNNLLIFEDFEKQGGMLQLLVKRKEKYEKTKFSIALESIEHIYAVTRSGAMGAIRFDKNPSDIPRAPGILRILTRTLTQILMRDGQAYYFELIDEKGFKAFIGK